MPTYEQTTLYRVWYTLTVVADNEEDAEELFDTLNPRKDGVELESSYEDAWIEEV
jgi:hypothetical protein